MALRKIKLKYINTHFPFITGKTITHVPSSAMFEDSAVSEDWDAKKAQVLARFAAQGTITVSTSFDILGRAKRGYVTSP